MIKKGRSCGRAQRAALVKFSEICHYIKPNKCRKYMTSLLVPMADIIAHGGELIQVNFLCLVLTTNFLTIFGKGIIGCFNGKYLCDSAMFFERKRSVSFD